MDYNINMMDKDIKKRKIAYHTYGIFNSGGMERVLTGKVNYLAELGYDVSIIITESGRNTFYPLSGKVKVINLDIGYNTLYGKSLLQNIFGMFFKQIKHWIKLRKVLYEDSFDLFITLQHRFFIPYFRDGSKKIFEVHFAKSISAYGFNKRSLFYKKVYNMLHGLQSQAIKKYDRFVVLTKEDLILRGSPANGVVIENALSLATDKCADLDSKRVISLGRLSYQKGYDYLLKAWKFVSQKNRAYSLHIYGGEDTEGEILRSYIKEHQLLNVYIHPPVKNVEEVLTDSSIFMMSSRYEGFPMVLLEAMECGLPCVSYACQCGPSEIIKNGEDGIIVEQVGDIESLSEAMLKLMEGDELRHKMGANAKKNIARYGEREIMAKWESLFNELLK